LLGKDCHLANRFSEPDAFAMIKAGPAIDEQILFDRERCG
jgi:hypothetical protein